MSASSHTLRSPGRDLSTVNYLPTLDGWRALAILSVLFCHGGLFYFSAQGPHPSKTLEGVAQRGWVGVDIFFAISGFLICTLLRREQHKTGTISLISFYVRRIFRILPPYLLYLSVIGILAAMGYIVVQRGEWISCLLFFRNYLPPVQTRDIGWYTGHFWSLAVEEHFYLLWPAMLLLLRKRRATQAALALIIGIAIWRAIDLHFVLVSRNAVEVFEHRTDVRMDSLLWGCIFAMGFSSETGFRWLKKWLTPLVWSICLVALLVLVSHFFTRSAELDAFASALRPPLFAAVVVATVVHPHWIIGRILEDIRLRWIGRISYSLYIWQQLFLVVQLVPRPLPFGRWQEAPWSFLWILLCAAASYYFVEQPLVRIGHRLARPQASPSVASSSSIALKPTAGSSA